MFDFHGLGKETDLCEESDSDLLLMMSMKNEDEEGALEAWEQFHQRHSQFIYTMLVKAGTGLDYEALEDVMRETMLRAYRHAEKYDSAKSTARTWLCRIADNLVKDVYRSKYIGENTKLEFVEDSTLNDVQNSNMDVESAETSQCLEAMNQAFLDLTERERDILRVWAMFYPDRLSPGARGNLAEVWNTTPAQIGVIRNRAMKKLETKVRPFLKERRN